MMSGLLHQHSQLPGRSFPQPQRAKAHTSSKFRSATPLSSLAGSSSGSDVCAVSSDSESYTCGAIHTGDSDVSDCTQTDIEGTRGDMVPSSPDIGASKSPGNFWSSQGRITLASLQKEAILEFSHGRSLPALLQ